MIQAAVDEAMLLPATRAMAAFLFLGARNLCKVSAASWQMRMKVYD